MIVTRVLTLPNTLFKVILVWVTRYKVSGQIDVKEGSVPYKISIRLFFSDHFFDKVDHVGVRVGSNVFTSYCYGSLLHLYLVHLFCDSQRFHDDRKK